MAVDPDNAAGSLRHDGATYYFCSLSCAQSFVEHPDRYTIDGSRHRD
jgi:Cu+-exporting ATPase